MTNLTIYEEGLQRWPNDAYDYLLYDQNLSVNRFNDDWIDGWYRDDELHACAACYCTFKLHWPSSH